MPLTIVHVQVKSECIEAFKDATMANVTQSRKESGVWQFDLCHQSDGPTRFVILEGYHSVEAVAAHKETLHYKVWRDKVADMMAAPRSGIRYEKVTATN